jgi:hypothetical protein
MFNGKPLSHHPYESIFLKRSAHKVILHAEELTMPPKTIYDIVPLLKDEARNSNEDGYESPVDAKQPRNQSRRPILKVVLWLVATALVLASTFAIAFAIANTPTAHYGQSNDHYRDNQKEGSIQGISEKQPLHCGNSVEEAIALGCTFDPMMLMWLHPECDRTGTDEYLEFLNGTLTYWVDREGRIPVQDLSRQVNDEGFWGEQRQHLAHCAFVYIRLIHAATGDGIYDRKTWSLHHATHCAKVLLEWAMRAPDILEAKQWAHVSFGTCWQKMVQGESS